MLRSEYVIRFFGQRTMGSTHYLFLEYADGGELFDRIGTITWGLCRMNPESLLFVHSLMSITHFLLLEPDHGMEPGLAHHFFLQLIAGMVSSVYRVVDAWCAVLRLLVSQTLTLTAYPHVVY